MKIVPANSLGMKEKDVLNPLASSRPQKSEGMLSLRSLDEKLLIKNEKASKALSASQLTDYYKIKGSMVDKLA